MMDGESAERLHGGDSCGHYKEMHLHLNYLYCMYTKHSVIEQMKVAARCFKKEKKKSR